MICAFCNENIDDDSLYCDQCGEAIKVCEKCGKPGTKKRCTADGANLIFKKDARGTQQQSAGQAVQPDQASAGQEVQPGSASAAQAAASSQSPAGPVAQSDSGAAVQAGDTSTLRPGALQKLYLTNDSAAVSLEYTETALLGRAVGPYIDFFAAYRTISRQHALIEKNAAGWFISDKGSANGTSVDSMKLLPDTPTQLNNGNIVQLADITFTVEIR